MTIASTSNERPERRAAVVLGLSETGLAVARSLVARGVAVYGVQFGAQKSHGQFSRAVRFRRGPEQDATTERVLFLQRLAAEIGHSPTLLATGDQNLLFVHRHRTALQRDYRFLVWDSPRLEEMASKQRLGELGRALGLPTPPTLPASDRAQFLTACAEIGLPCLVKPEYTHLWQSEHSQGTILHNRKALPVMSEDDAREVADAIERSGQPVVVQKLIVGPDENHVEYPGLVDAFGRHRAAFVARKLRVSPPHYGMGCYVESAHDPEVIAVGRQVLDRLEYRGLGMVQFKRDANDGRLYLLEINPRFTVWTGLPVACGVDLPWYYYCLCNDIEFQGAEHYPAGVRWINGERDFFVAPTHIREGKLNWARWAWQFATTRNSAYFKLSDPGPGLFSMRQVTSRALSSLKRRVRTSHSEQRETQD